MGINLKLATIKSKKNTKHYNKYDKKSPFLKWRLKAEYSIEYSKCQSKYIREYVTATFFRSTKNQLLHTNGIRNTMALTELKIQTIQKSFWIPLFRNKLKFTYSD